MIYSKDKIIYFYITNKCNYSCKYCYMKTYLNKSVFFSDLDKFKSFFNKINFKISLGITGGEPTLHPNLIPFLDFIKTTNIQSYLFTSNYKYLLNNYNFFKDKKIKIIYSIHPFQNDNYDIQKIKNLNIEIIDHRTFYKNLKFKKILNDPNIIAKHKGFKYCINNIFYIYNEYYGFECELLNNLKNNNLQTIDFNLSLEEIFKPKKIICKKTCDSTYFLSNTKIKIKGQK